MSMKKRHALRFGSPIVPQELLSLLNLHPNGGRPCIHMEKASAIQPAYKIGIEPVRCDARQASLHFLLLYSILFLVHFWLTGSQPVRVDKDALLHSWHAGDSGAKSH